MRKSHKQKIKSLQQGIQEYLKVKSSVHFAISNKKIPSDMPILHRVAPPGDGSRSQIKFSQMSGFYFPLERFYPRAFSLKRFDTFWNSEQGEKSLSAAFLRPERLLYDSPSREAWVEQKEN